jgi:hypothetical protein
MESLGKGDRDDSVEKERAILFEAFEAFFESNKQNLDKIDLDSEEVLPDDIFDD